MWSSPALDPDAGELYLTTSNARSCGVTEQYALSMVELHAATLNIVGSWQVPANEAFAEGDFGATLTLFTASLEGVISVQAGTKLLRPGMGRCSLWEARVPPLEESFAMAACTHLIQPPVPFSGSTVSRPPIASWLR